MVQKAPGKAHREGITLVEITKKFSSEAKALAWIESVRWPKGPHCPHCGSFNVQSNIKHKSQTHRCRDCAKKPMFTVRVGTVMHRSHLPYREWAIGLYLYTTNIKGISSMRLHRELGITQKSAWYLLHRLRKASEAGEELFAGPVEVDETYMGGKRKNMSNAKRKTLTGRGAVGKTAVAGAKDRETNKVAAKVVNKTDKPTLQGFVKENVEDGSELYTDEHSAYEGIEGFDHEAVKHSVKEYVRGYIHTNGIEAFWAMFKRAHKGTYHKMSPKHLQRYINEFVKRHNMRNSDTIDQMRAIVAGMAGKQLRYRDLIAGNGLASGARS